MEGNECAEQMWEEWGEEARGFEERKEIDGGGISETSWRPTTG